MKDTIKPKTIDRKWYVVDAKDVVLGRAATKIAQVLRGKHRSYFSPQWDMGDNVIVINAEKITVTGKKEFDKLYYRHSGYPGGISVRSVADVRKKQPELLIIQAVKGMLPKNRLQKQLMQKLYVYAGNEHPHMAQNPEHLEI